MIVEIIPNIWISDIKDAHNINFIKLNRIKIIINCSENLKFPNLSGIKQIRIPVSDSQSDKDIDNMNYFLPDICETLYKILNHSYNTETRILIFCFSGKQRSPTIVAAFLIKYLNLDLYQAVKIIQTKLPIAFTPQINFYKSLLTISK